VAAEQVVQVVVGLKRKEEEEEEEEVEEEEEEELGWERARRVIVRCERVDASSP
jgi:hypothetical protein